MALAILHQRCQHIDFAVGKLVQYQAHDLLGGVFHHLLARQVRHRLRSSCIEQTQVVIYLGGSAHGASRVLVHCLLPYRYHRIQPRYLVNIRPLQHAKHVAGIRRESFQVAALPLGKYRVECQRRLAAPTQPRNHRELVVRYVDIDILQVMHACPKHAQPFGFLPLLFHCQF